MTTFLGMLCFSTNNLFMGILFHAYYNFINFKIGALLHGSEQKKEIQKESESIIYTLTRSCSYNSFFKNKIGSRKYIYFGDKDFDKYAKIRKNIGSIKPKKSLTNYELIDILKK